MKDGVNCFTEKISLIHERKRLRTMIKRQFVTCINTLEADIVKKGEYIKSIINSYSSTM